MDFLPKDKDDFILRDYQIAIVEIGIARNTIIFLPTGSGKTLIAGKILQRLSRPLQRPLSQGGKISILLVNTVALVDQHAQFLRDLTDHDVACFVGSMNVDYWSESKWRDQLENHQILIMTTQILLNILRLSILSLNDVNLLIFDECHNAVGDHCMTQVMSYYPNLIDPPRVIGLSATLLNKKCKQGDVLKQVALLESTFHSKVATLRDLNSLIGYSTNPQEEIREYDSYKCSDVDTLAITRLDNLIKIIQKIHLNRSLPLPTKANLHPLNNESDFKNLINVIKDLVHHIEFFGSYCAEIAAGAHVVQLQRMKKHCKDDQFSIVIDAVISTFTTVQGLYQLVMASTDQPERIRRYSSPHVNKLFDVLKEYQKNAKVPLCGIIFVKRRFTAKVIYNVLKDLKETNPSFSFLDPNFVVGFNTNPYNNTREGLFNKKMNMKVLNDFKMKSINLLVASNVLEEGVDIPMCTLVVHFSEVANYRGYIQSKGRARHKDSFFYMLVNKGQSEGFCREYEGYQEIEDILNLYLTRRNEDENEVEDLEAMDSIPPYYVNGPDSPQVNLLTAIPLLCMYCSYFPADKYTTYAPNWYVEYCRKSAKVRVTIELPSISGILDPIVGPFVNSKKLAKRAAALETCKILHQKGELDDKLRPKRCSVVEKGFEHYFKHWPTLKETDAGSTKKQRIHNIKIPEVCKGSIVANRLVYLHVIELEPLFKNCENSQTIQNLYEGQSCYGFLSSQPLPKLCQFSLYISDGGILVHVKRNYKQIILTEKNVLLLESFHYSIFKNVLRKLEPCLVMDNSYKTNEFLIVPVVKKSLNFDIDFETAIRHQDLIFHDVIFQTEHDLQAKLSVNVTKENYTGSIVTPWYRRDDQEYMVLKVCDELSASSAFPKVGFTSFAHYFNKKYGVTVINKSQPLLLVTSLSKKLNCIKPNNKNKEKRELLIPELCVKQEFPGALWLQATLLPSILNRIMSLLQADELRITIAKGIGFGLRELPEREDWAPLVLDKYAQDERAKKKESIQEKKISQEITMKKDIEICIKELVKDLTLKKLNTEYPWNELDEPLDIERQRNVTLQDVQFFDRFVSYQVSEDYHLENAKLTNTITLGLVKDYIYKEIQFLKPRENIKGPELRDIFAALATAKSNDIVNLERLETLGDSFLKFGISLFLLLKYPKFDEGMLSSLKAKLISNKNLFYIGNQMGIGGYAKVLEFGADDKWKPPKFNVPKILRDRINKAISIESLFQFSFMKTEQIYGILSETSNTIIISTRHQIDEDTENVKHNSAYLFLDQQAIRDKSIADCVEALLGAYFQGYGVKGGLQFLKWLDVVPRYENIDRLFEMTPPSPVITKTIINRSVDYHIPGWEKVEAKLCYKFKNRAYLLQALSHASYTSNRITNCYQTLEFLGDAVLDFLITCYIYEASENLSPGDLTDLRSALVNNITFACYTVRCGFQKHLQYSNQNLTKYIETFVRYQELNKHKINEEVLTLISEGDIHMGEHIDVPKVLGDTFEALIGAVFLDSGMCLDTAWKVIHRIMWKEMELFMANVPKNPIRMIHEAVGVQPKFGIAETIDDGHVLVKLEFVLKGVKKVVYGAGDNKALAKKAAAKIALRLLSN